MRREIFIHLSVLFVFIFLLSIVKELLSFSSWPLWLGAILGTILPDLDHFIYVYFLSPQDLTSQRANFAFAKKDFFGGIKLLYDTRRERPGLILHTAYFQIITLVLTVFVFTSSAGFLGIGLVLGLSLHFLVDQLMDFLETGSISSWFRDNVFLPEERLTKNFAIIYWIAIFIAIILLALLY